MKKWANTIETSSVVARSFLRGWWLAVSSRCVLAYTALCGQRVRTLHPPPLPLPPLPLVGTCGCSGPRERFPCIYKCPSVNVWHAKKDTKPYLEVPAAQTIVIGHRRHKVIGLSICPVHHKQLPLLWFSIGGRFVYRLPGYCFCSILCNFLPCGLTAPQNVVRTPVSLWRTLNVLSTPCSFESNSSTTA